MLRKETLDDDIENDFNHKKRDFYGFAIDPTRLMLNKEIKSFLFLKTDINQDEID